MAKPMRQWDEAQASERGPAGRALFDAIGAFLEAHHLDYDPISYEFAHSVCSDPNGAVAHAVATLTEGGIRLTRKDIESLGGIAGTSNSGVGQSRVTTQMADGLVAQTQLQVEGFQDLVAAIRLQTVDFGRNLEQSAKALTETPGQIDAGEFVRLTTAMLARVRVAETQLEEATQEAAELRGKLEEARDNARRDPLTGLPNRRAFEEAYAERMATGRDVCVAVCDIDHFKQVNDGFGHAVGDRVLKAIGDVLQTECADHFVARYGGEEFVVVFCGITLDTARATLDSAREQVARKRYRLRETDVPLGEVTFSGGVTVAGMSESSADSFRRADELLYVAKGDGRNCIKAG